VCGDRTDIASSLPSIVSAPGKYKIPLLAVESKRPHPFRRPGPVPLLFSPPCAPRSLQLILSTPRKYEIPLFAVESKRSLAAFDALGFSLAYELGATNILEMLALANIPVSWKERQEPPGKKWDVATGSWPLIFAGEKAPVVHVGCVRKRASKWGVWLLH
jgi:hypothetical protein